MFCKVASCPALFNININNIVKFVLKDTDVSFFVDDFALRVRDESSCRVERAMQLCVYSVQAWIQEHEFKIKNGMYTLLSTGGSLL